MGWKGCWKRVAGIQVKRRVEEADGKGRARRARHGGCRPVLRHAGGPGRRGDRSPGQTEPRHPALLRSTGRPLPTPATGWPVLYFQADSLRPVFCSRIDGQIWRRGRRLPSTTSTYAAHRDDRGTDDKFFDSIVSAQSNLMWWMPWAQVSGPPSRHVDSPHLAILSHGFTNARLPTTPLSPTTQARADATAARSEAQTAWGPAALLAQSWPRGFPFGADR